MTRCRTRRGKSQQGDQQKKLGERDPGPERRGPHDSCEAPDDQGICGIKADAVLRLVRAEVVAGDGDSVVPVRIPLGQRRRVERCVPGVSGFRRPRQSRGARGQRKDPETPDHPEKEDLPAQTQRTMPPTRS